jgi:hypothetical protein
VVAGRHTPTVADISILDPAVHAAPKAYLIKGSQELVLKSVTASYDGSGAAGSFVPAVQVVDPSGFVTGTFPLGATLAAGASADISWFPLRGAPCPTPTPVTPLGTIFAWYDFADTTTITLDGSGNISQILDKTGNGHDAAQSVAAQRPGQSTVNGLNAGLFANATSTELVTTGFTDALAQPFSVVAVFTQDGASSATYFPGPYCGQHGATNAWLFCNGPFNQVAAQAGTNSLKLALATPFTQHFFCALYNGNNSAFYLDGVHTSGDLGTGFETMITLGRGNDNVVGHTDHLIGKLCELIFYNGLLTTNQITLNRTYVQGKWATP